MLITRLLILVGGPVVGRYAPKRVVMGSTPFPTRLGQTSPEITPSQVVVQLRGMYPMIDAQVIVRT